MPLTTPNPLSLLHLFHWAGIILAFRRQRRERLKFKADLVYIVHFRSVTATYQDCLKATKSMSLWYILIFLIAFFLCCIGVFARVFVCLHLYIYVCVRRSESSLVESILSCHVNPGHWTHSGQVGNKCLYPLSLLAVLPQYILIDF